MSVYMAIERALEAVITFFWRLFIFVHELKNIWKKRRLVQSYAPSDDEARQAREYWKEITGHSMPLWWHRLYASYTGHWDARYIPEVLFSVRLEPNGSHRVDRRALDDKKYLALFAGDSFRLPREYVSCRAGVISCRGGVLSAMNACEILFNAGSCVLKRTRDTSSGRDVMVADFRDGVDKNSGISVADAVNSMGDDWICQELVMQHDSINAIYPDSVNTLRIVTYLTNDGVSAAPVVLRLGRGGSRIDNAHAGGIFVSVAMDGSLGAEAFTEYQDRFYEHPDTHLRFSGFRIEGVSRAVNACKERHLAIGEFGFISWDVVIGESCEPVLIEVNLTSQSVWLSQMSSGQAMFGDDTPAVVHRYWKTRTP